jgi:hypothetical protein
MEVGGREVDLPVAVEIVDGDRDRTVAGREVDRYLTPSTLFSKVRRVFR